MARKTTKVVIGLTGAFGSGCSTAAEYLRDDRNFLLLKLSNTLRDQWKKKHGNREPSRPELQQWGDELREKKGGAILATVAMRQADQSAKEFVVIETIRNRGEIARLREYYGYRFFLFAVLASSDARWLRIGGASYTNKGRKKQDFIEDDVRDHNEETPHGQEVELCIDQADILINNSADTTLDKFKEKVLAFADLVTGESPRFAREDEILMNMAYSASHSSKCLKRSVGAVVVAPSGSIVGVGYNENPLGTKPCVEEPDYQNRCFRDLIRNAHFETLSKSKAKCPECGKALKMKEGPPWRCAYCLEKGRKINLEKFFFPDRAMSHCTAVHAEVWAILAAGERARGSRLYTTTFPCFQCAEKIAQAGIKSVCFTEAYPDPYSERRLKKAGIELSQFDGVRSTSFDRIFAAAKKSPTPTGPTPTA